MGAHSLLLGQRTQVATTERIAGILLVAAGVASVLAPMLVAQWKNSCQGARHLPIANLIRIVRDAGVGFFLIGLPLLWLYAG